MTTGYLLDTDILIDWLRGQEGAVDWMMKQAGSGQRIFVSGISVAELLSGTAREQQQSREQLLREFEYAPYTFDAAKLTGQLRYDHLRSGTAIALPDLIQAAIALTENLTVATANTVHFPDVRTINPRQYLQPN